MYFSFSFLFSLWLNNKQIGYSEINPGCELPDCNNNTVTVIHTIADGVNDSIHYIWDFTGPPSILIALTPLATRVTFNWTAFFNNDFPAIKFSKQPIYSASTVLTKVWFGLVVFSFCHQLFRIIFFFFIYMLLLFFSLSPVGNISLEVK